MNIAQIRDIVRENVGRDKISEHVLSWSLDQGLREIEKCGNFYWMRAVKTWSCVVNQQSYSVTTSTSNGLNIPNFKSPRILLTSDQTLSNPDWDEVFGPIDMEDVGLQFADTDDGQPVAWGFEESTITATQEDPNTAATSPHLLLYPPNPDKTYSMRLHYFQWTSLPASTISSAHEVVLRWPEALIYMATEQALISITKDPQYATVWHQKFSNPGNPKDPGELEKIVRYNRLRTSDSRSEFRPFRGGLMHRRMRWRRNREIWI
jgi:hypothetical protein